MSRATLTSINKPHTDNIFTEDETRKKTVECRTKPLPKGLHYVYETKNKGGCGKVIGEMTVVENIKYADISAVPHETILKGRVGARQLDIYSKGRPLYANVIVNAKRYDEPKELEKFHKSITPHKICKWCPIYESEVRSEDCVYCCKTNFGEDTKITKPPQSYCFVESL